MKPFTSKSKEAPYCRALRVVAISEIRIRCRFQFLSLYVSVSPGIFRDRIRDLSRPPVVLIAVLRSVKIYRFRRFFQSPRHTSYEDLCEGTRSLVFILLPVGLAHLLLRVGL